MGDKLITHPPTHPVFLSVLARDGTKLLWFYFTHFATLIGPMIDPPTHYRPFANKRDKVGMDDVPEPPQNVLENGYKPRAYIRDFTVSVF